MTPFEEAYRSIEVDPDIFGYMQPRLIASEGDAVVTYKHSRIENVAQYWTTTLLKIKKKFEPVQDEYNYCILNRYRSVLDSVNNDNAVVFIRSPTGISQAVIERSEKTYRTP